MVEPHTPLTVTLKAADWDLVIFELGEAKINRAAGVWLAIQEQCKRQDREMAAAAAKPNGAAHPAEIAAGA